MAVSVVALEPGFSPGAGAPCDRGFSGAVSFAPTPAPEVSPDLSPAAGGDTQAASSTSNRSGR
jgi:hypothetical protein